MAARVLGLFPGQGSQKVGMGKELYDSEPLARDLFERASRAINQPLTELCFSGPAETLTRTEFAQPAILTVSVICFELAKSRQPLPLVAVAGHSLGEYSALVAAGALEFEDAARLVHQRGRYMQDAVPVGTGKMVAVLGQEIAAIERAIAAVPNNEVVEIANINAPGQVVVAGSTAGIDAFVLAMSGAKIMPLPVSAPFHCSLMKPAADKLTSDLRATAIKRPSVPVYCNVRAEPLTDPEAIRQALIDQVCGRVRWVESMERALRETNPDLAVEFGEGSTLAGLLKRIAPTATRFNVNSLSSLTIP